MSKRWVREAAAGVAALVLIFVLAIGQAVGVYLRSLPAEEEAARQEPFVAEWATVTATAAAHSGPGLRYPTEGWLPVGVAVEVVWEIDGYCKCLTYMMDEPVWVSSECLERNGW